MEQTTLLTPAVPVGEERLREFMEILQRYRTGRSATERRIIDSENWWKLRNLPEGREEAGFRSRSGWLHNVIVSKHADAMEACPEPNILPREAADREEARRLSAILPCILEQNQFEGVYSDVMWQKLKTGTGVYKVPWDARKLGGLGDIAICRADLLSLYWEPGITDIQKSPYFFQVEEVDKEALRRQYPDLADKALSSTFPKAKFRLDDPVSSADKVAVVEVYYHKDVAGRATLQYCRFVEDTVLFATENCIQPELDEDGNALGPSLAETGLYDHGLYPYVFDPLFPIEGSPCGYGYVDLCRNPQTAIDLLNTAFIKNARVGALPRYFTRVDGNVNEEEFLDLSSPLVRVAGNVDEATLRRIEHVSLDGNYMGVLDRIVEELRSTSGNTEAAAGTAPAGVTAASAIAALQEAGGKGSRDSTMGAYRAFSQVVNLCIELVRQFYSLPRQFRITGPMGSMEFVSYTNAALRPRHQGEVFGRDMGWRLPVFDIKVSAQRRNVYTKVSQNELALQLYKLGFFRAECAPEAMLCLEMMDFDGKEELLQRLARGMEIYRARQAAASAFRRPKSQEETKMPEASPITGLKEPEHALVTKARTQAANAPIPEGTT